MSLGMTKHDTGEQSARIARANSYEFHKNIFRSSKFDDEQRKASARWLIANGVQFDEGKLIDPERLPS